MPTRPINLLTPLSLRTSFLFPIQSPIARREVIIGALWLLVPVIGWFMNMGHRIILFITCFMADPPGLLGNILSHCSITVS